MACFRPENGQKQGGIGRFGRIPRELSTGFFLQVADFTGLPMSREVTLPPGVGGCLAFLARFGDVQRAGNAGVGMESFFIGRTSGGVWLRHSCSPFRLCAERGISSAKALVADLLLPD